MSKNVIFMPAVINKNLNDKYGGYEWMDISMTTWKYWCKKHDIIFYEYNTPSESDLMKHRITWQRWFDVFDVLERDGVDYNKIHMVDATCMVRWDTPNYFDLIGDDFYGFRDMDNLNWIHDSIVGYKDLYDGFELDISKYINSGSCILNKKHKPFLQKIKDFYYQNHETILRLQDETEKKGTCQTNINYFLQKENIKVGFDLPAFLYRCSHLHRKELFSYNWQLQEDKTPYFIKYGYVWKYNGIPKNQRTDLMKKTWEIVEKNYV